MMPNAEGEPGLPRLGIRPPKSAAAGGDLVRAYHFCGNVGTDALHGPKGGNQPGTRRRTIGNEIV